MFSNHYEVSKYYTLDQHSLVPDVLIIGTKYWDKLSIQEQKWLQEAANESSQAQKEFWNESVKESLKIVKDFGVEIIIPKKSLFINKTKIVVEEFKKEYPRFSELLSQIIAQ